MIPFSPTLQPVHFNQTQFLSFQPLLLGKPEQTLGPEITGDEEDEECITKENNKWIFNVHSSILNSFKLFSRVLNYKDSILRRNGHQL